jgi:sugar/nucleoside kinase (ribokinase family)
MQREPAPEVVVVGAASRDLAHDDARGWRLGGGVSFSGLALARLGLRTGALIGVDGSASGADELALLRDSGVRVVSVPLARGPVFENIETAAGRIQHCRSGSEPIPASAVPLPWADAPAWLLAPVAGELGAEWAAVPGSAALVGLGWQGLLRALDVGSRVRRIPPRPSPLLDRADIVGVGRDDLEPATPIETLAALLRPGARLLLTHGIRGGLAVEVGADGHVLARRQWPAIPADATIDPTGAGDVFLAGVVAARVQPRLIGGRLAGGWDLRLGAAMASLVCEMPGLGGVPNREAIQRRLARPTMAPPGA